MRLVTLYGMTALVLAACGGGAEESSGTMTPDEVAHDDGQQQQQEAAPPAPAPAPAPEPPAPPPAPQSLTERLGGRGAIAAVVHSFVEKVLADRRIKRFFRRANREQLEAHLTNQICHEGGGDCPYEGRTMEEAHDGMRLTDAHFDAIVEDLMAALDEAHVADAEKNELLGLLGPMRAQIVGQ